MKRIAAFLAVVAFLQGPSDARAGEIEARDINDFIVKIAKDIAGYLKQAGAAEVAVVPFKNADNGADYALSEVLTGALVQELRYSYSDFQILGLADGAPAFRVTGLWKIAGNAVQVTTRKVRLMARRVKVETGEIFEAPDVIGVEDDLFELEDALGAKLLADIQRYR